MAPGIRALLLALVVLGVGLCAVFLEVETMRSAERIRGVLVETEQRRESMRRSETEVLKLLSPDMLVPEVREALEPVDDPSSSGTAALVQAVALSGEVD